MARKTKTTGNVDAAIVADQSANVSQSDARKVQVANIEKGVDFLANMTSLDGAIVRGIVKNTDRDGVKTKAVEKAIDATSKDDTVRKAFNTIAAKAVSDVTRDVLAVITGGAWACQATKPIADALQTLMSDMKREVDDVHVYEYVADTFGIKLPGHLIPKIARRRRRNV